MQKEYKEWKMDLKEVNQRISGWLGHAKQANTLKLREQIFQSGVFQRGQARR
jgi:kynureninase